MIEWYNNDVDLSEDERLWWRDDGGRRKYGEVAS
jgi:hypothetical protein